MKLFNSVKVFTGFIESVTQLSLGDGIYVRSYSLEAGNLSTPC